jgi:hypothetical protein
MLHIAGGVALGIFFGFGALNLVNNWSLRRQVSRHLDTDWMLPALPPARYGLGIAVAAAIVALPPLVAALLAH